MQIRTIRMRMGGGLAALMLVSASPPVREFALTLRPTMRDGAIDGIAVVERIGAPPVADLRFAIADRAAVFTGIADRIGDVALEDARGPVELAVADDPATGSRTWRPARAVAGSVTLRYHVRISRAEATAPVVELRADGGAVSGYGSTFLLLPSGDERYRARLAWDLSALPGGSVAVTSLDGIDLSDVALEGFRAGIYAAGRLTVRRSASALAVRVATDFTSASYSMAALMAWADTIHARMAEYFHEPVKPMTVVFRGDPHGRTSGLASDDGLFFTLPMDGDADSLGNLVTHEIAHFHFTGPATPARWFAEGLATHLARDFPYRAGLRDAHWYAAQLNAGARDYYGNPARGLSMDEVDRRYWTDPDVRTIPYERGAVYFALTDLRLRRASGGRRGLVDVLIALDAHPQTITIDRYLALVEREIGGVARRDYKALLTGTPIALPSNAFGHCLRSRPARLSRFDLGFETVGSASLSGVVRAVTPGSAAARAGLRDGDTILPNAYALDAIRTEPDRAITLSVQRGGERLSIVFAPAGAKTNGVRWEAVCRAP